MQYMIWLQLMYLCRGIYIWWLYMGVGRVCFSGLGSGYGFWDLARVGSRVSGYWARVKFFSHFSVIVDWIWQKIAILLDGGAVHAKIIDKMVEQWMSNQAVVRFWSLGLDKIIPRVARVLKIIVRVWSAKKALGRVKSQVGFWPDPSLISSCPSKI